VTTRHESVLSLEGLNESDEGTYSCHINSDFNNIISFNIRVQGKQFIHQRDYRPCRFTRGPVKPICLTNNDGDIPNFLAKN